MNRLHRAATVTNTIAEGTYAVNTEGRVTFVNPSAERLLGWRRADVLGEVAFERHDLCGTDGGPLDAAKWPPWQAMSEGRVVEGEICIRRPDGHEFPALYAWAPIRHEEDVTGAVCTFRDITERKRAEEALAFQKALLEAQNEAYGDGVLILDREGGFVSFNRRFVEMWRIPRELVDPMDEDAALAHALTLVEDKEAFFAPVKRIQRDLPPGIWDELRLKDGRVFERYGAPLRMPDGTHGGQVWSFHDATKRKR